MNEESHHPSIEPQLEARIVALVLGEASEFERDELHRLIEERPELAAFFLQMQCMHGLLQDVGAGEFVEEDEDWKLPAERRNAVLAVIRGEATVQTSASNINDSVQQQVPGKRNWRWNLTGIAAVLCVVGFFGIMALPSFFTPESIIDFRGGQWGVAQVNDPVVVTPYFSMNQSTSKGWLSSRLDFEDGRAETDVEQQLSKSSWFERDNRKNSESALSSIRDTLKADGALPSGHYLKDDVQFFPAGPVLGLPKNAVAQPEFISAFGEMNLPAPAVVDGTESTRRTDDDSELIAKNEGAWRFQKLREEDRNGNGLADSQPTISGESEPDLSFTEGADIGAEASDSTIAAIRLRTGVADGEALLTNALSSLSAAEGTDSNGKSDAPLPAMNREIEELSISGTAQGVSRRHPVADLVVPIDQFGDSPFGGSNKSPPGMQNPGSQTSGPGPGQTQLQLGEIDNKSRDFSIDQLASPAGENGNDSVRILNETKWMANIDRVDSSEAAEGTVDKRLGDLFERGGRRFGTATGNKGFGGGGGFGSNLPSDEWEKKMPADAKGVAKEEQEGFASFDDSGVETLPRYRVPASGLMSKTRTIDELTGKESLDLINESKALSIPTNESEVPRGVDRKTGTRIVSGKDTLSFEKKKKVGEMRPGDYAERDYGLAQENQESLGIHKPVPAPVTGAGVVQSRQNHTVDGFNSSVKSWERPPSKQKEQQVELQRESRGRGLEKRSSGSRFGYVAPVLVDKSKSMTRRAVKRIAAPAGLNEKAAAEEAFSTFSLHVSDVSFKLALAALARGEWPEAAKVRIEEFVNAFDYGDPMPRKGEKVACHVEQSIHPFVQQRNLLRVSMRTAAAGRSSNTPLRLTFLLDNSGSMERIDRQQTVRRAFALLAQQLTPNDQVTLISFARQPRLLADKVSGAEAGKLVRLIDKLPSEGGTNIEAALQLAFEKAREQQTPDAQNRIILLTDGAVNLGDANPDSLSQMVLAMRNSGIAFDAAGISAEGLNDEVLEALTRKGDGRYYLLDSLEAADDGFARQIAGALRPSAKNVKVQIEFNPKRVGRYKLLGFEKHILKKEDFRNDQVDAAEMAAAEAGVALYQFEAKPDGEGDVGSVSVRFRDLSTGQMIENRWPIPYEAAAPRADQAAPSLRIAASAALLAAKLRGEPQGETVDLQTLSHLISGLPDQDRNDMRVQQLQQMIGQARQMSEK